MVSNFKTSGIDLDNTFAKRNWFNTKNGLWGFGSNASGSLGLDSTINRSSPTQISVLETWKDISSAEDTTIGIQKNGTIWFWGRNSRGNSGITTPTSASSPTQIGTLSNWSSVSVSPVHSVAVKSDGTLWSWGYNLHGQLGGNNTTSRSSPVQVGSSTSWSKVSTSGWVSAFTLYGFTMAIGSNGTLWSWGTNVREIANIPGEAPARGILGLNNTIFRSSPTQIGSSTDWEDVSCGDIHSLAIKTNGSLWAWGYGGRYGLLGLNVGPLMHRSSPVQVGSLTDWNGISAGQRFSLATKTDGTLWSWGRGNSGQLGLGNTANRSSPTQIGSLTNWRSAKACEIHSVAVKSDGTLWTWGFGSLGRLGRNSIANLSSPVQVGTQESWKSVFGGASSERTFVFKSQGIDI
jgi:alpha-tubulin suppressor-like RCC1 family protein